MTEQQACTLCGADGHRAFECPMRIEEHPPVLVPWSVLDRAVMWVEDRRRYGDAGTIVDDWMALKSIQRAALAQHSPAPELERPEVVAWALQRKRDGFVRATWHQKPSETQYEIAELDGDVIAPLYAAPSVSTWKAPEGFALVPIEPTVAMRMPWKTMRGYSWHSKYKAMLAAAAVQRGEL